MTLVGACVHVCMYVKKNHSTTRAHTRTGCDTTPEQSIGAAQTPHPTFVGRNSTQTNHGCPGLRGRSGGGQLLLLLLETSTVAQSALCVAPGVVLIPVEADAAHTRHRAGQYLLAG